MTSPPSIALIALRLALVLAALPLAACSGAAPQSHTFTITTANSELSSGIDTFTVTQGDNVTFALSSDSPGVFHVHGYDLRARVEAGGRGDIQFEAGATGRFEIAFHPADDGHDAHDTTAIASATDIVIAWLEVQPG